MTSPKRRTTRRLTLALATLLALAIVLPVSIAMPTLYASDALTTSDAFNKTPGGPKLTPRLGDLAQESVAQVRAAASASEAAGLPADGPGSLMLNDNGEVLVNIRVTDTGGATVDALKAKGANIAHVSEQYGVIVAYVPTALLSDITNVAGVLNVHEELQPVVGGARRPRGPILNAAMPTSAQQDEDPCPSDIISEGDQQMKVDQARQALNVDGSGITIGVVSDSYNLALAETNATEDIASGDLPGPGNPCGRTTPINIVAESTVDSNIDEGRAMLQIVHDLAPGANLAFATANGGVLAFADNIRRLRAAGASVIVDDIAYFVEPFFQDGPVSVAIQDVTNQGALYFTAAGNSNTTDAAGRNISSYEAGAYRPTACPALISQNGPTTQYARDCHDFNPEQAADGAFNYTLQPGGSMTVIFQWAEPWEGVQSDLDIYLATTSGQVVTRPGNSVNPGAEGNQRPFESLSYTNQTSAPQNLQMILARVEGAAPRLKYILLDGEGVSTAEYHAGNSSDTFGPSVFGHSAATQALSMAAVPFNNPNAPEDFSSLGGATMYFGPVLGAQPASALPTPENRIKPDVAATNGTRNTFFGNRIGGVFRFFGTSAAAPHAAAVGALMQQRAAQRDVMLTQNITEGILESTAAPMSEGSAPANGAGLIDAIGALYAVESLSPIKRAYLPITRRN
jgi:hypothetical protein